VAADLQKLVEEGRRGADPSEVSLLELRQPAHRLQLHVALWRAGGMETRWHDVSEETTAGRQ